MAPIVDGEAINATNSNRAWIDAEEADATVGRLGLLNVEAASGPVIPTANGIQRMLNALASYVGMAQTAVYNVLPSWTSTDAGSPTDDLNDRAEALSAKFNFATGHDHSGAGKGAPVTGASITGVPLIGVFKEAAQLSAVTGGSSDVSAQFTLATPSLLPSVKGVVVDGANNKCILRKATGTAAGDEFTDALGNEVYGRLTESTGVWTLTFYVKLGTVETAYSFGSASDIGWYYQQLFNKLTDAPVYSEFAKIPSENATADVIDASATDRGVVTTLAQTFAGVKTFAAGLIMQLYFSFQRADVASAATIAALSSSKSFVRLTGTTATDLQGITAGVDGQYLVFYNQTNQIATLKHESGSASAVNRLFLPGAIDMSVAAGSSAGLIYDTGQSRWVIAAGSGGGSVGSSDLLPTVDVTYNIGSASFRWLAAHVRDFVGYADAYFNEVRVGRGAGNDPENLAVGKNALATNATGTVNTAVGRNALRLAAAGDVNACVALGNRALDALTSGNYNTALGHSAAAFLVSGDRNTSIGSLSGPAGGSDNFACGQTALTNTIGNDNTGVGNGALNANYTGSSNAAIGKQSLVSNTTGSGNTGVGFESLFSKDANYNVGIGYRALKNATTGDNNVGIGSNAGMDTNPNVAGSDNTYIGANTGNSVAGTLTKAVAIGSGALVGASNAVAIGGTGGNAVKVGVNNPTPAARMHLPAGTASAGTAPLKIDAGTNMTATEIGAIESTGTDIFWTNSSGVRKSMTGNGPALVAPTLQKFTSGSGTYTRPTSPTPLYIVVEMLGGGGGGGGNVSNGTSGGGGAGAYIRALIASPSATYSYGVGSTASGGGTDTTGTAGNDTTFGSNTAGGGGGGTKGSSGTGGAGGTATLSLGVGLAVTGTAGNAVQNSVVADTGGGIGGAGAFGGGPLGAVGGSPAGSGAANSGSGGNGGTATTGTGGDGAAGVIVVTEYYQ
jgi:hypothetical protein